MKIAMVTAWFPPIIVGSGNRFYEIGKRLARKHEIDVYTLRVDWHAREEMMDGMHIHRYGRFNISKSGSIEESYHLLKLRFSLDVVRKLSRNFDIIDCNIVSKVLPFASYLLSKISGASVILTWHEIWHMQNFKVLNPMLALPAFFIELFIPRLADVNIAVSGTTKRRLVSLLGADPKKTHVIPNGVDMKKFRDTSVEKKYGRILYIGRLESHKRVDTLIRAYRRLKRGYADIELIIVGTGSQKPHLKALSRELNLEVEFLEPLPYERLVELMKSAWVLVLPSVREGQGIVLLEAMAAGTPPVAVNAPGSGVVDAVTDGYNGLLAPSAGERELESAIERLLTNEDLYERLRKNGLEFVKKYDWEVVAKRTEEVYEQAQAARARAKKGGF